MTTSLAGLPDLEIAAVEAALAAVRAAVLHAPRQSGQEGAGFGVDVSL
jgi:hypothetical protein